jgi:hypothetical protein
VAAGIDAHCTRKYLAITNQRTCFTQLDVSLEEPCHADASQYERA